MIQYAIQQKMQLEYCYVGVVLFRSSVPSLSHRSVGRLTEFKKIEVVLYDMYR